ncbi:S-adenosyl-L-methionine-dependent methyltransferase superfamily protein [Trifolium repens]|nr:S-adenosyl-L-methionine-dependent methyltransferase superfamily protein [Trifolium repens]
MLLFIYSDRLPDMYDVMGSTPTALILSWLLFVVSDDTAGVLFGSIIQPSERSRTYGSSSMPSACLSEKCILLLRHIAPTSFTVSVCDRKQALSACISHGAVAKLLVSGQQYTLGFTAIAIHFQAVTNFVLFLYQIFILPVIQTKKVDDLIEAGANLRAKLGLDLRTSNK